MRVLVNGMTAEEFPDHGTVGSCRLVEQESIILALAERERHFVPNDDTLACYWMEDDGSFSTAPSICSDVTVVLRRLDGNEYPWMVKDFEVTRLGRFAVKNGSSEFYARLQDVRPVTTKLIEHVDNVCAFLGRPSPFAENA